MRQSSQHSYLLSVPLGIDIPVLPMVLEGPHEVLMQVLH